MNNRRAEPIAGATVVELPYSIPVGAPFQKLFGPSRTTQHELIQQGEIDHAVAHVDGGADLDVLAPDLLELENVLIELCRFLQVFDADGNVAQTCHGYLP